MASLLSLMVSHLNKFLICSLRSPLAKCLRVHAWNIAQVLISQFFKQLHTGYVFTFLDILPRLKPWDSLDSGSVIQPYRLKYSHCVQDLC